MVPDPDSQSFHNASFANASIITDIGMQCGFLNENEILNKHCTAIMLVKVNSVSRAIVQDWLANYKKGLEEPYFDQHALNLLVPKYGSGKGMEALASDLVLDPWTRDDKIAKSGSACFKHFKSNTQLLKESLASSEVSVFVHWQKESESLDVVKDRIGADLQLILQRSSDMVQEIEIGHELQQCIENDECTLIM